MHGLWTGSDAGTASCVSSAAGDVDERSCGVGSLVREQPWNRPCDLDGMADATQRANLRPTLDREASVPPDPTSVAPAYSTADCVPPQ